MDNMESVPAQNLEQNNSEQSNKWDSLADMANDLLPESEGSYVQEPEESSKQYEQRVRRQVKSQYAPGADPNKIDDLADRITLNQYDAAAAAVRNDEEVKKAKQRLHERVEERWNKVEKDLARKRQSDNEILAHMSKRKNFSPEAYEQAYKQRDTKRVSDAEAHQEEIIDEMPRLEKAVRVAESSAERRYKVGENIAKQIDEYEQAKNATPAELEGYARGYARRDFDRLFVSGAITELSYGNLDASPAQFAKQGFRDVYRTTFEAMTDKRVQDSVDTATAEQFVERTPGEISRLRHEAAVEAIRLGVSDRHNFAPHTYSDGLVHVGGYESPMPTIPVFDKTEKEIAQYFKDSGIDLETGRKNVLETTEAAFEGTFRILDAFKETAEDENDSDEIAAAKRTEREACFKLLDWYHDNLTNAVEPAQFMQRLEDAGYNYGDEWLELYQNWLDHNDEMYGKRSIRAELDKADDQAPQFVPESVEIPLSPELTRAVDVTCSTQDLEPFLSAISSELGDRAEEVFNSMGISGGGTADYVFAHADPGPARFNRLKRVGGIPESMANRLLAYAQNISRITKEGGNVSVRVRSTFDEHGGVYLETKFDSLSHPGVYAVTYTPIRDSKHRSQYFFVSKLGDPQDAHERIFLAAASGGTATKLSALSDSRVGRRMHRSKKGKGGGRIPPAFNMWSNTWDSLYAMGF